MFKTVSMTVTTAALSLWGALAAPSASYPYPSKAFSTFVSDSYAESPAQGVRPFDAWLADAYTRTPAAQLPGAGALSLDQALDRRAAELAGVHGAARSQLERDTASWLHAAVKAMIPRFSLDRGFEFTYTVARGERQCLLQSVLISGLMQRMGMNAGVDMVWRNEKRQESNLGHMVTVLKLTGGEDVQVDASDPQPFMRHSGLFAMNAATGQYNFLEPVFTAQNSITAYKTMGGQMLKAADVAPLTTSFLRSQFYFYRGERAPGGFLGNPKTAAGLAASTHFLERALETDPENPLATYVLGRVYQREGLSAKAAAQYLKGYALYQQDGYVPAGPKEAYAWAGQQVAQGR